MSVKPGSCHQELQSILIKLNTQVMEDDTVHLRHAVVPRYLWGTGSRIPYEHRNPMDAQVPYKKWGSIFHMTYICSIDDSRVCLAITSLMWIEHSSWCMANANFAFWNFLGFFFSIFQSQVG